MKVIRFKHLMKNYLQRTEITSEDSTEENSHSDALVLLCDEKCENKRLKVQSMSLLAAAMCLFKSILCNY